MSFVVERAHAHGIPVIVDAAAQLPPKENLWRYTRDEGADVALFSGGKGMSGPQNSGLAVGSAAMIEAMRLNGPPYQRIGRSLKVSKEAMIGLMTAVESYLETDFDAQALGWQEVVDGWSNSWEEVCPEWYGLERSDWNEAGEPIPRMILRFDNGTPGRDAFIERLRSGKPSIEVVLNDPDSIAFSPHLLSGNQAEIVSDRVASMLKDDHLGGPSNR